VDIYRDTAAIVGNTDNIIGKEYDLYLIGKAAHRLIATVVKHLPDEVMEAIGAGSPDIHAGPPAHRLEPLKNGNISRTIGALP
jgi:hypothetical protein